jgi:cytochrome c oxidase assembly protein subunit 15
MGVLLLRRLGLASLVANVVIVVTGGAVRLTSSGLGCPTWPRCTDASYRTTPEMGVHGVIEFGNRTLTFVLVVIAGAALLAALLVRPRRRALILLASAVVVGIAAQAVIGGMIVHNALDPALVGLHFVVSMLLILATFAYWRTAGAPDGPSRPLVPRPLRLLTWLTVGAAAAVVLVGVLVTGSGPHAGDAAANRNGLDPQAIAQVHADLVFLLIGLSVGLWFAMRAGAAPTATVRAAGVLVAVELAQALIGFVQYFTGLPEILVGVHLLGACLVWIAALSVVWSTRERVASAPRDRTVSVATDADKLREWGTQAARSAG